MQQNRYILQHQDCTFGEAGKRVFWHLESIDNQHIYIYKNHSNFTGKEKDSESGYYYFGARYLDQDMTTLFLSVDPMTDKYPGISPYAYCAWNPIKLIDPNGMEINPIYSSDGDFLGNTKEGFTGEPLIMYKSIFDMMMMVTGAKETTELSVEDVLSYGGSTFDEADRRGLNDVAQEKIVSHIISQYEDSELSKDYNYNSSDVAMMIRYCTDEKILNDANFTTYSSKSGKWTPIIYFRHNNRKYEFTVENIISSVVYHEWLGHVKMGWGNGNEKASASKHGTHYACYLSVMISPIFWKTTHSYQIFNQTTFNSFFQ